jgi:Domain of unknown function (DUF4160)
VRLLWRALTRPFASQTPGIESRASAHEPPTPEEDRVPRISAFYGIAIYMYYRDHAPPHFHAIYGEHEATVAIETADVLEGKLPRRARALASISTVQAPANTDQGVIDCAFKRI